MEWIPGERRKRGRPRKNVDGRCTSSHENKTFRSRSVVKQKGIVFGFRKTATAVTRPERQIDRFALIIWVQYATGKLSSQQSVRVIGQC